MDREFEMVVFDMDGVLVDVHSSWSWVHDHFDVNNDHSLRAYLDGEIDDLEFIRRDIALWKEKHDGITREEVIRILNDVPVMPGYQECMSCLREQGYRTAIISGGLKPLAERVGMGYFDKIMANDLKEDEEGLTGEGVLEVYLNDKGKSFDELMDSEGTMPERSVAVGNSFIDAPMLERAGLGIAFNPADERVRYAADVVVEEKDLKKVWSVIKEQDSFFE